jgi:inositol phosphorylceramide mannosyltransferase catalytic subunit
LDFELAPEAGLGTKAKNQPTPRAMIPPILHQTWKSKTELPHNFRFWQQSFLDLNPELELRVHDDADNRALLEQVFPSLLPLYDSFPSEIFRVDFIRPVYMFAHGGFYADMDFQCLQPLNRLEQEAEVLLGAMGTNLKLRQSIPNAFMASLPGEGFWIGYLAWCDKVWAMLRDDSRFDRMPELVVGPVPLHAAAQQYSDDRATFIRFTRKFIRKHRLGIDPDALPFGRLAVLPSPILYPIDWRKEEHGDICRAARDDNRLLSVPEAQEIFPDSVAVTYWASSWREKRRRDEAKPG